MVPFTLSTCMHRRKSSLLHFFKLYQYLKHFCSYNNVVLIPNNQLSANPSTTFQDTPLNSEWVVEHCVLNIYCALNNNTFKLFSKVHIISVYPDHGLVNRLYQFVT